MFKHLFLAAIINIVNLSTEITKYSLRTRFMKVLFMLWLDQNYLPYIKYQNALTVAE